VGIHGWDTTTASRKLRDSVIARSVAKPAPAEAGETISSRIVAGLAKCGTGTQDGDSRQLLASTTGGCPYRIISSWLCGSACFLHFLRKPLLFERFLCLFLHVFLGIMTLGHTSILSCIPIFDCTLALFYRPFPLMSSLFLFWKDTGQASQPSETSPPAIAVPRTFDNADSIGIVAPRHIQSQFHRCQDRKELESIEPYAATTSR
jgi:hypothetical protein